MSAQPEPARILLTGATGAVGGRLLPELLARGHAVTCLVRDRARAALPPTVRVIEGDVLTGAGLKTALDGADVAYYLVHSMGRGSGPDFEETDRRAAARFADAAREAGTARIVYLGGLPSSGSSSRHLRSRGEVAELLERSGRPTIHVRAAMVIGSDSASFLMLRQLVQRLPAMVGPKWIDTRTQPIAARDVTRALADIATFPDPPSEVQLGGADVLTYRDMMQRFARADGRREPLIVPVPLLSPRLSSYWVRFVTSVEPALARPLVDGLSEEMIVRVAPPAGLNDNPLDFDSAVREALAQTSDVEPR